MLEIYSKHRNEKNEIFFEKEYFIVHQKSGMFIKQIIFNFFYFLIGKFLTTRKNEILNFKLLDLTANKLEAEIFKFQKVNE
jgi:hypothetical protein